MTRVFTHLAIGLAILLTASAVAQSEHSALDTSGSSPTANEVPDAAGTASLGAFRNSA